MSKTLVALVGDCEYGWALQMIQRLRYQATLYDKVVIYCEEPLKYLCEDFGHEFILYKPGDGWRDRWLFRKKQPEIPKDVLAKYPGASKFVPTRRHCTDGKAIPFKYGQHERTNLCDADVLFHARWIIRGDWIDRACGGHHNWSMSKWRALAAALRGHKIACIGAPLGSRQVGDSDYRGLDMKTLCTVMAHAKVVVGESSFPCHLTNMCGTPTVVISHNKPEKSIDGKTNGWRHKIGWNPFGVPVKMVYHPRWNPDVDDVLAEVKKFL